MFLIKPYTTAMTRHHALYIIALLLAVATATATAQNEVIRKASYTYYVTRTNLPNGAIFLPAPPDTASLAFADDFLQWQWGKTMRGTKRGNQANQESQYGMTRMCIIFGQALGITLSEAATPALYKLMIRAGETANLSIKAAKQQYMRRRPFDQMNEHTWAAYDDEASLRNDGSYPSGHTALGWGTALALAEAIPEKQDTILRRGYQYGESRVIGGVHWQSDVEAGRLCASAAIARMHVNVQFEEDVAAARAEYLQVSGITPDSTTTWPHGLKVLDTPINATSTRFYSDVAAYWDAKKLRDTQRGMQAAIDTAMSVDALLSIFGDATGHEFLPERYPVLSALLSVTIQALDEAADQLRAAAPKRLRPFAHMAEEAFLDEEQQTMADVSSYPSKHAQVGWGVALVLTEVAPALQNYILLCGHEYGTSREIAGQNYASDVQAGRLMASAVIARLHANDDYKTLMEMAKEEYNSPQIITHVTTVVNDSRQNNQVWYTLSGLPLRSEPSEPGIYVHNGKVVLLNK